MTIYLKQSTASQEVPLGHFVDDGDGVTAMTGLTIANTDIKVWKTGATTLANKNSGGATHISGGIYYCVLDATDTNTVGPLVIYVAVSGALAVKLECDVLPANVYDARYGADLLDVNVSQFGNSNGTFASGRPEVNTTLIEGSDATNQIRDAVVDDATRIDASALNTLSGHDPGETIMGATDLGTGAGLTSLASAANLATVAGYLDTEIAAIKDKTDQFTFTVTGKVDSNITHVNETEIAGDGEPGTEFGPA